MTKEDEMLQELRKIREAVEKAPSPLPPKGYWNEFKDFLSKFKVFGLAVAFIIGLYLGGLVLALVKDLLVPLIGIPLGLLGFGDLATKTQPFAGQNFLYGDFLVALITFLIVVLIVFIIVKVAKRMHLE